MNREDTELYYIKSNRRPNSLQKGFTLVELIVVLVIITILAAVAVPVMLGFTDSAKEKQYTNEAKIALTSAQSMMSHVYNDNLDSVPQYLRKQAFDTSGLDKNTEFLIWTKAKFDDEADGTYNSIAAYTIESALYRSSDGEYVYYISSDSSNSNKESWDITTDLKDVPKFDQNGNIKKNTNLIVVWSDNAQYAGKDTAKGSNRADNSGVSGENESTTPEDKKDDSRFDTNQDNYDPDEVDENEKKVLVNYIGATNKSHSKNVVYFDEKNTSVNEDVKDKEFWYGSLSGFRIDDEYSNWDLKTDSDYDATKLTWSYEINPDDIKDSEGFESVDLGDTWNTNEIGSRILSVINFLNEGAEITVTASIDQKYYNIPMTFRAYKSETQNVSINPQTDAIICKYGRGEKDISYLFGSDDESDSVSELTNDNIVVSSADENRKIKFSDDPVVKGKWLVEIKVKGKNTYLSDRVSTEGINGWIPGYLDSLDEAQAKNLENNGMSFIACGNIYKTIYIAATEGSEKKPNRTTFSFGSSVGMQTDEGGKSLKIELSVTEYDNEKYIYNTSGETDTVLRKITNINTDSLFGVKGSSSYDSTTETDVVTINKGTQHVKSWQIFDCDKSTGTKLDNTVDAKTRKWDCTSYLLDRLFAKNAASDAEYAELDTADFEALLQVYKNDPEVIYTGDKPMSEFCPFRKSLATLAPKGVDKIEKVLYVSPNNKPDYKGAGFKGEVCVSTTTLNVLSDGTLEQDADGNYVISHIDDDYPAYIVAYSVLNSNNKYTIYVFSDIIDDDDEVAGDTAQAASEGAKDFICKGDLINMFRDLSSMNENTLLTHMDTSGVKSFMNLFKNCKAISSIDVSHFIWDNCTRSESMFSTCSALTSVNLGKNKNTQNLNSTREMFFKCSRLNSVNISEFDTSNVEIMIQMFQECNAEGFKSVELHIDSVSNMTSIFDSCGNLETVKYIGGGDEKECPLATINDMYKNCNKMKKISINNIKMKNINGKVDETSDNLYALCGSGQLKNILTEVELLGVHRNDGCVTLRNMFKDYTKLEKATFDAESLNYIENISGLFQNCYSLTNVNFNYSTGSNNSSDIASSTFKTMESMFNGCCSLSSINLSCFRTPNLTNLKYAFKNCFSLTELDLSNMDTNNVTAFDYMFDTVSGTYNGISYNTSSLQKVSVSDSFVVKDSYKKQTVFGNGLTNLVGGNGTTFSTSYKTAAYAHIDLAGNPGYFTSK